MEKENPFLLRLLSSTRVKYWWIQLLSKLNQLLKNIPVRDEKIKINISYIFHKPALNEPNLFLIEQARTSTRTSNTQV